MLTLPIKRKWFDMILSGEKLEEYRKLSEYYQIRFDRYFPRSYTPAGEERVGMIKLRAGYSADAPSLTARCSLTVGTGRPEWGADPAEEYYVLKIEKIKEVSHADG